MKYKISLFFIFFYAYFFSQGEFNVIIEYKTKISQQELKGFLVSNEKKSFFLLTNEMKQDYEHFLKDINRKINPYYLFYYEKEKEKFYQTLSYFSTVKLGNAIDKMVEDSFDDILWNIDEGQKKNILGYLCQKATGSFRGRNYSAWFTIEISNNSFPWKLKGLPGTILSFEDSKGFFKGEAEKVTLNKIYSIPQKVNDFFSNKSNRIYQYKEAIEYENAYLEEFMEQRIASFPKGTIYTKVPIRESCLEKTFEWENSKKP